ncbi:MAG: S1C family serine protease [Acidobacteriota bacterium]
MDRVVVTTEEIAQSPPAPQPPPPPPAQPEAAIPLSVWSRIGLAPLVLLLPVLCIGVLLARIFMRRLPQQNRLAWLSCFSTLLSISGVLTSVAVIVLLFSGHAPVTASNGLAELDSRSEFPVLPASEDLNAEQTSQELNPLVTVVSPVANRSFWGRALPGTIIGAGVILSASPQGYLIATARHVVDSMGDTKTSKSAMVASISGIWSNARVVARHNSLDLALIWLARHTGDADFDLPIAAAESIKVGEPIALIGHPQGLRFTLSTGIVSRKADDTFQISAPVSPGDSGGPVFDARGRLVGIVTSMVDKSFSPNAENLNFAVRADALGQDRGWSFLGQGREYLDGYIAALHSTR